MQKPTVDYKQFRLSKIREPEFAHLLLLLGWVGFFALFYLTESFIPAENCYPVCIWLDDYIPFQEVFLIPYVFWYLLIAASLIYFLLYDVDSFKRLQTYIIITQLVAMIIYILFPSRQDLRPAEFQRDNFLTRCVAFLYNIDTNTGVCPSLHVAISVGIASVWTKKKDANAWWKVFIVICAALVCLSTVFIKQHSAADFFAAIPVCLLAEGIVYFDRWKRMLKK